jgi:L-histidine N-alpha-methyltransferase
MNLLESPTKPSASLEIHLRPADLRRGLIAGVKTGLSRTPKELSPKWLYDERGSNLFDEITRLPEYYPTRREREILVAHAGEIAALTRADTLVELGSGTSDKTRILLSALEEAGTLRRFIPFDVSEAMLRLASSRIARDYRGVAVHAVAGDFEHHLGRLPRGGRRLVAFLGGTVGNIKPGMRRLLLRELAETLRPGDGLLLGTDLIKDRARLYAAYNDSAGVTAEFNLNVLAMLNRELGADFELGQFRHEALFSEEHRWIEMHLCSLRRQRVHFDALGMNVDFAAGERMRTEVSAKFTPAQVRRELAEAGFRVARFFTDARGDYGLSLAISGAERDPGRE